MNGLRDAQKVYFVCTGNTCRSPMAERILQEEARRRGINLSVGSRKSLLSSTASSRKPFYDNMTREAQEVIVHMYHDREFCRQHLARAFFPSELENADMVIGMGKFHKFQLADYEEVYRDDCSLKVYSLGEIAGEPNVEIRDPFNNDTEYYCSWQSMLAESEEPQPIFAKEKLDPEYLATFEQIQQLIRAALDKDADEDSTPVPVITMADILRESLTKKYNVQSFQRIVGFVPSRYTSRPLKAEIARKLDYLHEIYDLYDLLVATDTSYTPLCGDFSFLSRMYVADPLHKTQTWDRDVADQELKPVLLETAKLIPKTMASHERHQSFAAMSLAEALSAFAANNCTKETAVEMCGTILDTL